MAEHEQVPQQKKKTPKVWNVYDADFEFTYAPPKPDGDPWDVLLKPRMDEDIIRCQAWKEEVNNLLIFAGLFSAVVTAFVVESYKTLQPDPNSTVVDLLSRMATRLDNPLDEVSPITSIASFSPSSSSIRVNILWFLSLILSLTTVLVGIITLQWLREYQSYPGLTPKQSLAVFQMRSEGMEKWYVWKIFTALPLLLQAALALFLIGVVDFLLTLDNKVAIPISVVIGLILLFLLATTALPTLQGLYLYLPFLFVRDLSEVPSQCPYKSPQSHVFRAFFSFSFHLFDRFTPALRYAIQYPYSVFTPTVQFLAGLFRFTPGDIEEQDNSTQAGQIYRETAIHEHQPTKDHHVIPQLLPTWTANTWVAFDSDWLLLRDACANGLHDQSSGLNTHRLDSRNYLPLFDSVQAIQEAVRRANLSHTDPLHVFAIYDTFSELSKLILEWPYSSSDERESHRPNRFFYGLWKGSESLDYEDEYQLINHGWWANMKRLHCQNMKLFVTSNNSIFYTPAESLSMHVIELDILLANRWSEGLRNRLPSNSSHPLPHYLQFNYSLLMNETHYWQYSHVLMKFFKYAAKKNLQIGPDFLLAHHGVARFLDYSAWVTLCAEENSVLHPTSDTAVGEEIDLREAYRPILIFIRKKLNDSISSAAPVNPDDAVPPVMSYFFYISAIYMRSLMKFRKMKYWKLSVEAKHWLDNTVNIVLPTMRQYKEKISGVNSFLEDQFAGEEFLLPTYSYVVRFSKEWWATVLNDELPPRTETPSAEEGSQPQLTVAETSNSHTDPAETFEGDEGNQAVGTSIANGVVMSVD
ncbi:hypothetical protein GALMADRAFT_259119 [Galerina marginata CBS 339.88]|uniref:DUF6535 domain-containing protein n=1 Tax=Galerina marginata (strain CBS 339.88) TaxID=685588 RepID=A0A067S9H0_GALM3|nr:hypothetical protein GALMADRAFT_259119 [Galerina marginata CBS 339.88]